MQQSNSVFKQLGSDNAGPGGGFGGFSSSGALGALSAGTSAVSALSNYTLAQGNADNLQLEAGDEKIAARDEYTQAQEKSNLINRQYNSVIGKQLSGAAAGGIDIASGSVVEEGRQAQTEADRQLTAVRNTAQMNANLRTSRAIMLQNAANITRETSRDSLLASFANTGLSVAAAL